MALRNVYGVTERFPHRPLSPRCRRISPAFHDLLFLPSYLVPAMQLVRAGSLRLWHDQVFAKPARNGSVVAWHQDYRYGTARHKHTQTPQTRNHAAAAVQLLDTNQADAAPDGARDAG